ncbi:hypothetical protein MMC11_008599 [Xylographa trunciseda]|nr:hypothetical protein [Xylographa trunciseda]
MADRPDMVAPQPSMPLKRKLSDLYSSCRENFDSGKPSLSRLQLLPPTPETDIDQWVTSTLKRRSSYSDVPRPRTTNRLQFSRSDGFLDTGVEPNLLADMAKNLPFPEDPTKALPISPSEDSASTLNGSSKSNRPDWACTDHSLYRSWVLKENNIIIHPSPDKIPNDLLDFLKKDITVKHTSPTLTDDQVSEISSILVSVVSAEEAKLEHKLFGLLFPQPSPLEGSPYKKLVLTTGGTILFNKTTVPDKPRFARWPICQAKPDNYYGYNEDAFTQEERLPQTSVTISPLALPSSTSWWPFFSAEWKSQSRKGTHYFGQNQTAGTGASCLHAFRFVTAMAKQCSADVVAADSLRPVFLSCTIDHMMALLSIHWYEDDKYQQAAFQEYVLRRPDELRNFHHHVLNIIDFGMETRLSSIRKMVRPLIPWAESDAAKPKPKRKRDACDSGDGHSESASASAKAKRSKLDDG